MFVLLKDGGTGRSCPSGSRSSDLQRLRRPLQRDTRDAARRPRGRSSSAVASVATPPADPRDRRDLGRPWSPHTALIENQQSRPAIRAWAIQNQRDALLLSARSSALASKVDGRCFGDPRLRAPLLVLVHLISLIRFGGRSKPRGRMGHADGCQMRPSSSGPDSQTDGADLRCSGSSVWCTSRRQTRHPWW